MSPHCPSEGDAERRLGKQNVFVVSSFVALFVQCLHAFDGAVIPKLFITVGFRSRGFSSQRTVTATLPEICWAYPTGTTL